LGKVVGSSFSLLFLGKATLHKITYGARPGISPVFSLLLSPRPPGIFPRYLASPILLFRHNPLRAGWRLVYLQCTKSKYFMDRLHKTLIFSLLGGGLLFMASCQEGTSKNPNPNPKTPPLTIRSTLPEGARQMDSAAFQHILQNPNLPLPDSLPVQRPKAKRKL
jgi:hypothetical protein